MPYTVPTPEDFTERYPDFPVDDDDVIQVAITAAARNVDETWTEGDFQPAILALAAHFLIGSTAAADVGADDAITGLTIGPLSLQFAERQSFESMSGTIYGQEFMRLQRLNVAMVAVI